MAKEVKFYKASGKFSWKLILVALPITGVVIYLDAFLYAYSYLDEEELKDHFLSWNLGFMEKADGVGKDTEEYYQIDAEWCDQCQQLHTWSLRKIMRTWDKNGKEELNSLPVHCL